MFYWSEESHLLPVAQSFIFVVVGVDTNAFMNLGDEVKALLIFIGEVVTAPCLANLCLYQGFHLETPDPSTDVASCNQLNRASIMQNIGSSAKLDCNPK